MFRRPGPGGADGAGDSILLRKISVMTRIVAAIASAVMSAVTGPGIWGLPATPLAGLRAGDRPDFGY